MSASDLDALPPSAQGEYSRYDSETRREMEELFLPGLNIEHISSGITTKEQLEGVFSQIDILIDESLILCGGFCNPRLIYVGDCARFVAKSLVRKSLGGFGALAPNVSISQNWDHLQDSTKKPNGGLRGRLQRKKEKDDSMTGQFTQ